MNITPELKADLAARNELLIETTAPGHAPVEVRVRLDGRPPYVVLRRALGVFTTHGTRILVLLPDDLRSSSGWVLCAFWVHGRYGCVPRVDAAGDAAWPTREELRDLDDRDWFDRTDSPFAKLD